MEAFLNAIKRTAAGMDAQYAQPRFALVASVDPVNYAAKVLLQPEGVLSGWLPILTQWVGAGWGLVAPPQPGDQVLVLAHLGQADHGVIIGRAYSLSDPAPAAPAGELWLVHATGSFLKLHNDGTIEGHASQWNLTGNMVLTGNLDVIGNIQATEDITDQSGTHGTLANFRTIYDEHVHNGVQGGLQTTQTPTPQV